MSLHSSHFQDREKLLAALAFALREERREEAAQAAVVRSICCGMRGSFQEGHQSLVRVQAMLGYPLVQQARLLLSQSRMCAGNGSSGERKTLPRPAHRSLSRGSVALGR